MRIEVDKADLIAMVKGCDPHYDIMQDEDVQRAGYWSGGMSDSWHWRTSQLTELTPKELYELYVKCKNSWK